MLDRFRNLVEQHQNRVFTFALYQLRDRGEAEDVTQEVLLRLWNHLDKVEAEKEGAWLVRVTRNACYDLLRGRRSRNRVLSTGGEARLDEARDPGPSPEAGVATWDVGRHLQRALGELEEPYRSIVILREIQELKYEEISEAMEIPLNTVKTYLHRARRKLREKLREVHCYA